MAVILPTKRNLTILQAHETLIGNGHAMGIAAQVFQHLLGSAEGGLGVNHPVGFAQGGQIAGESEGIAQRFPLAEEMELAVGVSLFQSVEEEAPEQIAEDANGEEE